jgi:hypothetical protein
LLLPETARAREAVHRWRVASAAEARLTRALKDGVGTAHLSKAIKEAAAAGVKVGESRRLLKVMQGLEAAMQQAAEGPFQYQALKVALQRVTWLAFMRLIHMLLLSQAAQFTAAVHATAWRAPLRGHTTQAP